MDEYWCGTYRLDENKNAIPCSFDEWAKCRNRMVKEENKHVGHDVIDGKFISTVWLGLDHQWNDNGPPLLFETMVFVDGDYHDIYCDRYSTWKEAEEGHKKAVEWVNNGCKEDRQINE